MAKTDKPNILIIWGDDIGYWNISRYSMGMMGYPTPNIDRIGQGRGDVHRLVRSAELHRGPGVLHLLVRTPSGLVSPRSECPAPRSDFMRKIRPSPKC